MRPSVLRWTFQPHLVAAEVLLRGLPSLNRHPTPLSEEAAPKAFFNQMDPAL
jgi:hypothetical protein